MLGVKSMAAPALLLASLPILASSGRGFTRYGGVSGVPGGLLAFCGCRAAQGERASWRL